LNLFIIRKSKIAQTLPPSPPAPRRADYIACVLKSMLSKETLMQETILNVRVPNSLLSLGLTQEEIQRRVSEWLIFSLFSEGKISSGKAGKLLGISRLDFIKLLQTRGIAFINFTEDELNEELEAVKKLAPKRKK
jgi:predicted HTH domain antitoxin